MFTSLERGEREGVKWGVLLPLSLFRRMSDKTPHEHYLHIKYTSCSAKRTVISLAHKQPHTTINCIFSESHNISYMCVCRYNY